MSALAHALHLTIPHHSNDFRARLLQPIGMFFLLFILLFSQFLVNTFTQTHPGVLGYAANIPVEEVIRITNQKRSEAGLSQLNTNSLLSQAAQAKGNHMLEYDYWAHVAPDGTDPWVFFNSVGYKYRYAGENLARDFSNPQAAVDAWMASPSHRDNLMSPKYTEIGIAVVEGDLNGVDTTLVVQLFGTPMSTANNAIVPTPAPDVAAVTESEEEEVIEIAEVPVVEELASTQELTTEPEVIANPLNLNKTVSMAMIGLLMVLLLIDIVVIWHRRVPRKSGRPIAHISFLLIVFVIIMVAKAGNIL